MTGPFGFAAPRYRERGWLGTLPIVGKDQGIPTGFTGRRGEWPSDAQVQEWCAARGECNIAIRLPRTVIGIDVDGHGGKHGLETLVEFEARYGALPPTWLSTARGGTGSGIRLYRVPDNVSWVSDLGTNSGIEIIRYAHRYAVVWPSIHPGNHPGDPATNQRYRWYHSIIAPQGLSDDDAPPEVDALTELPQPWVDALRKDVGGLARNIISSAAQAEIDAVRASQSGETDTRRGTDDEVHARRDGMHERGEDASQHRDTDGRPDVDPELMLFLGAPPGEQNNRMYAYVCSMRARNVHREEALSLGMIAIQRMTIARPEDPWTPQHVVDMVNRVWREHEAGTTAQQELRRAGGFTAWARGLATGPETTPTAPSPRDAPDPAESVAVLAPVPESVIGGFAAVVEPEVRTPVAGDEPGDELEPDPARDIQQDAAPVFEPANDTGNALRFARLFARRRFRYVPELKQWHEWTGQRWIVDTRDATLHATLQVLADVERQALLDDEHATEWRQHLMRSGSERARRATVNLASTLPALITSLGDLDVDQRLLACENGVVELTDQGWRLRRGRPTDAVSLNTNVVCDPAARSEDWERFVEFALPDPEVRAYMQMLDGYSLLGANPLRCWVMMLGPTATGKTTWLELTSAALGDYSKPSNLSVFRGNLDERPRADLVRVLPARRVHMVEVDGGVSLHSDQIKRATGGDVLTARLPHAQAYVSRVPAFTPYLAANEMPSVDGADGALANRLRVISFERVIDHDPAMVEVVRRLRLDPPRGAILTWMLEGWNRYARNEREVPLSVLARTASSAEDLSPLAEFIAGWCEVDPAHWDTGENLYLAYLCWCDRSGTLSRDRLSLNRFGRTLTRRGFERRSRTWVEMLPDGTVRLRDAMRGIDVAGSTAQKTVYHGVRVSRATQVQQALSARKWAQDS